MRSHHQTVTIRGISNLRGLGQDFWEYDYGAESAGTAVSVPDPTTAQGSESTWSQIVSAAKQIVPAYYAAKSQEDINQINLERMRRGQPPLPESYLRAAAPQVRAGLAPDTQRMIMILGGGLLVVLLLPMLLTRR